MRALIVDDSSTNLMLLAQLVKRIGCTPFPFADPLEALSQAAGLKVDLAIVDYRMPQLDGLELTTRLRAIEGMHDLPVVMITTSDDNSVRYAALEAGVSDFLRKPIDPVEVKSRLRNLLKLREAQNKLNRHAAELEEEVRKATRALEEREEEIIQRLSRAAEFRDPNTGSHIMRMARYSRLIAESLGLDRDLCHITYLAASMHDIGKIAVSDAILLEPGKLSPAARKSMEEHTVHGHEILADSGSQLIQVAAEIALCHHERWDGAGYPRGLRGESIPILARVAAVADVFDALTSERPYKRAWSLDEARDYLIQGAGHQFDPDCVAAFLRKWDDVVGVWRNTLDPPAIGIAKVA